VFVQRKAEGEHESSRRIKTQFLIEMEGCGSGSEQILLIGVYPFSYALLHFVLIVWIITMQNAHVNSSTRPFCVKVQTSWLNIRGPQARPLGESSSFIMSFPFSPILLQLPPWHLFQPKHDNYLCVFHGPRICLTRSGYSIYLLTTKLDA
jgi:hypothetical protein